MAAFYADERTARYIGGEISREQAWRRLAAIVGHWSVRGFGLWALEKKSEGRFVGYCGLWYPEGFPEVEVGWGLSYDSQRHGYATEAAARAQSYAYNIGVTRLVSYIVPWKLRSICVAERLGAAPAGNCAAKKRSSIAIHLQETEPDQFFPAGEKLHDCKNSTLARWLKKAPVLLYCGRG
jgi:ribosomal-protein-alanine N-acetyltransferase